MKNLIAKLLKGETLTDDEKAKLEAYDPDRMANDAAASARKKAEAERDAIKAQLEELQNGSKGKQTELEKLQKRIDSLEKSEAEAKAKAAALQRDQTIDAIRAKAGIKFIDGVDASLLKGIFAKQFEGLEDLADESAVSDRVKAFMAANKGLILDQSGGGTGRGATPGKTQGTANPFRKESFNLTEQIELQRNNPTEAARLKAEAAS